MSGKKPVKRRFKPKKPADVKQEVEEVETPSVKIQVDEQKSDSKKQKPVKPKKERKYVQIRGVLDSSGKSFKSGFLDSSKMASDSSDLIFEKRQKAWSSGDRRGDGVPSRLRQSQ